jgi:hypothetical protein
MKKKLLLSSVLAGALLFGGIAFAQRPSANIDAKFHPNLAEAQRLIIQAYQKTEAARAENKDELGGHAAKALALLEQADAELKQAAEFANHRK